jgi:hypothetical protein
MNTVLFVHGTGARDPHFSQALGRIREGLKGRAVVEPCYWGGTEGSKLNAGALRSLCMTRLAPLEIHGVLRA